MTLSERERLLQDTLLAYAHAALLADPARLDGWEEQGLTFAQLRALHLIAADPELPSGLLADRLGVRASTVTTLVDRLVARGLVERVLDAADRRRVRLRLSPAGRQTVQAFSQDNRAFLRSILAGLDDRELQEAAAGLQRLNGAAQERGRLVRGPVPHGGASLPARSAP